MKILFIFMIAFLSMTNSFAIVADKGFIEGTVQSFDADTVTLQTLNTKKKLRISRSKVLNAKDLRPGQKIQVELN